MSALKNVIKEKNLRYVDVAKMVGLSVRSVGADVLRKRLSAEKAVLYSRALKVHPAIFRNDVFYDLTVSWVSE